MNIYVFIFNSVFIYRMIAIFRYVFAWKLEKEFSLWQGKENLMEIRLRICQFATLTYCSNHNHCIFVYSWLFMKNGDSENWNSKTFRTKWYILFIINEPLVNLSVLCLSNCFSCFSVYPYFCFLGSVDNLQLHYLKIRKRSIETKLEWIDQKPIFENILRFLVKIYLWLHMMTN